MRSHGIVFDTGYLYPTFELIKSKMKIKLVAYGIAKDILKSKEKVWEVDADTIQSLKQRLLTEYPDFTHLSKLSFAVGEEYRGDDFQLKDGDEVVIIPPVSGG